MEKNIQNSRDLGGDIRWSHIHVIEVQEIERKGTEKAFEKIMTRKFPSWV